jgi:hypothetical protein
MTILFLMERERERERERKKFAKFAFGIKWE